jgi:hypothetical protein
MCRNNDPTSPFDVTLLEKRHPTVIARALIYIAICIQQLPPEIYMARLQLKDLSADTLIDKSGSCGWPRPWQSCCPPKTAWLWITSITRRTQTSTTNTPSAKPAWCYTPSNTQSCTRTIGLSASYVPPPPLATPCSHRVASKPRKPEYGPGMQCPALVGHPDQADCASRHQRCVYRVVRGLLAADLARELGCLG